MLKESETNGEWLTEEKMVKSGEYSKLLGLMIAVFATPLMQPIYMQATQPKADHQVDHCIL